MQTTNTQRQHLKALFSDKNGKAAFDELRKTLNTKKDIIKQISVENNFLLTTAIIFNECAPNATSISGYEETAHSVLHYILNEHLSGGDNALGQIEQTFTPV